MFHSNLLLVLMQNEKCHLEPDLWLLEHMTLIYLTCKPNVAWSDTKLV
jgi:hypothetical protein